MKHKAFTLIELLVVVAIIGSSVIIDTKVKDGEVLNNVVKL